MTGSETGASSPPPQDSTWEWGPGEAGAVWKPPTSGVLGDPEQGGLWRNATVTSPVSAEP